MSAHGADHEPHGKLARRTVTDFEPGRRFVWSNGDHLHQRPITSATSHWRLLPVSRRVSHGRA